jgi:hypothetical protein
MQDTTSGPLFGAPTRIFEQWLINCEQTVAERKLKGFTACL